MHASVALKRKLVVEWVPSCDLEDSTAEEVGLFMFAISIRPFYVRVKLINGDLLYLQTPEAYEKAWKLLKVSIKLHYLVMLLAHRHRVEI